MTRFEIAQELLNKKKYFKLVCGAGNEDAEEVRKLVFVYTLAGAKCMDVSVNADVVRHAAMGIREAFDYSEKINRKISIRPFINVSIGMRGDPHVRKAMIIDKCVKCGACIEECPTDAIGDDFRIKETKCIGCGGCESACNYGAVRFYHSENKDLNKLLKECKECGAEQFELHAAVPDSGSIFEEWGIITSIIKDNYVSMCLDRFHLSDSALKRRIKRAKSTSGGRLIIQADGVPMSGSGDDFNTTLQAVAIADIIMKQNLGVKVLLSGGTNNLTAKLADKCRVAYNGISIGTFARNLVKELIREKDFMKNDDSIKKAVNIADVLVANNIGDVVW